MRWLTGNGVGKVLQQGNARKQTDRGTRDGGDGRAIQLRTSQSDRVLCKSPNRHLLRNSVRLGPSKYFCRPLTDVLSELVTVCTAYTGWRQVTICFLAVSSQSRVGPSAQIHSGDTAGSCGRLKCSLVARLHQEHISDMEEGSGGRKKTFYVY